MLGTYHTNLQSDKMKVIWYTDSNSNNNGFHIK